MCSWKPITGGCRIPVDTDDDPKDIPLPGGWLQKKDALLLRASFFAGAEAPALTGVERWRQAAGNAAGKGAAGLRGTAAARYRDRRA